MHKCWLVLSLTGIIITSYIFEYKGTGIFIGVTAFFLCMHVWFGNYQIGTIPITYLYLTSILLLIIVFTFIFSFSNTDTGHVSRLAKSLIIVSAIYIISKQGIDKATIQIVKVLLCLLILWQFIAIQIFNMPFGTLSNRHYLANFAILSLPITFYFFMDSPKYSNILFLIAFIIDSHILLHTSSRPAIFGITLFTIFSIFLFSDNRYKWISLSVTLALIVIIGITNYEGIFVRFKDLLVNIQNEERWQLWKVGWKMLLDNSISAWIFGNGIGSVPSAFNASIKEQIPIANWSYLTIPHFHVLEILYDNGIIGAALIFGGMSILLFSLFKKVKTLTNLHTRILGKCLLFTLVVFLFHSSMTYGFYSKYSLYSLSFIIGCSIAILDIREHTRKIECQSMVTLNDKLNSSA